MRYWRSQDGKTIHADHCPSRPPFPKWWSWADGKDIFEIIYEMRSKGLKPKFCRKCLQ